MAEDLDLDDLKSTIRAIMISDPRKCCNVNNLYHEYRQTEGEELPFRKFNCRSTFDFLQLIPDTVKILDPTNRNSPIEPVVTEQNAHVFKLVCEQKTSFKKRGPPPVQRGFRFPVQRPRTYGQPFRERSYHPFEHRNHEPSERPRYHPFQRPFEHRNGHTSTRGTQSRPPANDDEEVDMTYSSSGSTLKFRDARKEPSNDFDHSPTVDAQLCNKLRSLFDEPENFEGIWLTKLMQAYKKKFVRPLSLEDYGFKTVMDLVKSIPNIFHLVRYRSDGDYLLLDARKYSQPTENNVKKERGEIPPSLIERLKNLLESETQIDTEDLPSAYERMYRESLRPEEYGFKNMDLFFEHLEDLCPDVVFRTIGNRIMMKWNAEKMDSVKSRRSLPGEVTYDPFPPEVCNGDFQLETDPMINALKEGDVFAVNLGEVCTPSKFYVTHINRAQLLKDLMENLNRFYRSREANYKVLAPLVTRNLLCACLYSGNEEWHRVRVTSTTLKTAKVFFLDYGTEETVDRHELRYLHKEFARLPPLCVCAKLSGVQPKEGDTYDNAVNTEFYEICSGDDLEMEVVRVFATCLEVRMYLVKSEDKKLSVQENLITRGFVARKGNEFSSPDRVATELYLDIPSCAEAEKMYDENANHLSADDVPEVGHKNTIAFFNKMVTDKSLKEKVKKEVNESNFKRMRESNKLDENAKTTTKLEPPQSSFRPPPGLPSAGLLSIAQSCAYPTSPIYTSLPSTVHRPVLSPFTCTPHMNTRPLMNQNFFPPMLPSMPFPYHTSGVYGQFQTPPYPDYVNGTTFAPNMLPFPLTPPLNVHAPVFSGAPYFSHPLANSPVPSLHPYSTPSKSNTIRPPPGIRVPPMQSSVPLGLQELSSSLTNLTLNTSEMKGCPLTSDSISSSSPRSVERSRPNSNEYASCYSSDSSENVFFEDSSGMDTAAKPERLERIEITSPRRMSEEISLEQPSQQMVSTNANAEQLKSLRVRRSVESKLREYLEFSLGHDEGSEGTTCSTSGVESGGTFVDGSPTSPTSANEKSGNDHVPDTRTSTFDGGSEIASSPTPTKRIGGKNFNPIRALVLQQTHKVSQSLKD